jgi:hypothetical protein
LIKSASSLTVSLQFVSIFFSIIGLAAGLPAWWRISVDAVPDVACGGVYNQRAVNDIVPFIFKGVMGRDALSDMPKTVGEFHRQFPSRML